MAWLIDYVNTEAIGEEERPLPILSCNWQGTKGELDAPYRFRLLDDDEVIYYEGWSTLPYSPAPLDEFGIGNAGCTEIQYHEAGGWWTTL